MLKTIIEKWNDPSQKEAFIANLTDNISQKIRHFIESSSYVQNLLLKNPQWLQYLSAICLEETSFYQKAEGQNTYKRLHPELFKLNSYEALFAQTRILRNQEMLCLLFRDFLGHIEVEETVFLLAELADFCIDAASLAACLKNAHSEVLDYQKLQKNLIILGMGKLGGRELNVSSDIDLIFLAQDDFATHLEIKPHLQNILIYLMDFLRATSSDGFCYRVDMRLRPEGDVGPLCMGIHAALSYYEKRGRHWEYQAMIKNRAVWGNPDLHQVFQSGMEKLIYAHHEAEKILIEIKDIKDRIEKKIEPNPKKCNVKLSAGGIRDIEFIIQFLQLIHGIRYPEIRKQNSLSTLVSLKAFRIITEEEHRILSENYRFLRKVENILQFRNNLSEQSLPESDAIFTETFIHWRIAQHQEEDFALQFRGEIHKRMNAVRVIFQALFDETIRYLKLKENITANYPSLSAELLQNHFLRMDSEYFLQFGVEDIARHIEMVSKLTRENLVELSVTPLSNQTWRLCIVAFDYYYEFSKIAGLISGNYLKILKGESFTYSEYREQHSGQKEEFYRRSKKQIYFGNVPIFDESSLLRKRKIVCVTEVGVIDSIPDERIDTLNYEPDWQRFKSELNSILKLLDANKTEEAETTLNNIILKIIPKVPSKQTINLTPIEIDIDNENSNQYTILNIKSKDSFAFLYTFTSVLALKNYYIYKLEIDTVNDYAIDRLFIMTHDGKKILDQTKIEELKIIVTMIKQYSAILFHAINPHKALHYFGELLNRILESPEKQELPIIGQSDVQEKLATIFGISDYLWEDIFRLNYSNLFPILSDDGVVGELNKRELLQKFHSEYLNISDGDSMSLNEYSKIMNAFKNKEMFRIDLRQLLKKIDFWHFAVELTELAEAIVELCLFRIEKVLMKEYGYTTSPPWALFGLGKLGGMELGYASDIELMLVYDTGSEFLDGSIFEYYERLLQLFIKMMESKREGIFEVDLNLRPYGKSGRLGVSLSSFREYFSDSGKAYFFERQALVKMRYLTANQTGQSLKEAVILAKDDFVYSQTPPDIHALYTMRDKQLKSYTEGLSGMNVKYSKGGMVEIEYITQILQIHFGKQYPSVRKTSTLDALEALLNESLIEKTVHDELSESYIFYRNLINILRMVRGNAKDLTIYPESSIEYDYLVKRSYFIGIIHSEQKELLQQALETHRKRVSEYFEHIVEFLK